MKEINGKRVEKKKKKPQWLFHGTSKSSKIKRVSLMVEHALNLAKRGKTEEAKEILKKAEKIKESS